MVVVDTAMGVAWALAALFALAIAHKLRVLRAGDAAREPLIAARGWSSRRPAALLALAAAVEAAVVVALLAVRPAGLVAAAALVGLYAVALRALPADEPCHCLGASTSTRTGTAMQRNVGLAGLAAVAAALSLGDGDTDPALAFGVALIVLAVIAALEAVERVPRPLTPEEP